MNNLKSNLKELRDGGWREGYCNGREKQPRTKHIVAVIVVIIYKHTQQLLGVYHSVTKQRT